jgi:transcription elongation GreA/GreB family factor
MKGRALLQYVIDISDITDAKKQEATEYLANLEEAAQQNAQQTLKDRQIENERRIAELEAKLA